MGTAIGMGKKIGTVMENGIGMVTKMSTVIETGTRMATRPEKGIEIWKKFQIYIIELKNVFFYGKYFFNGVVQCSAREVYLEKTH